MVDLEKSYEEELIRILPLDSQGKPTSLGSVKHAEGTCSPCIFFVKDNCSKGVTCNFCHFSHDKTRALPRRKKSGAMAK